MASIENYLPSVIVTPRMKQLFKFAFLIFLFIGLTWFAYIHFPMRIHWTEMFRPAALELLHGHTPYSVVSYKPPPWGLLPFLPLAFLPERLGFAIYSAFTLFCLGIAAYRMGANPLICALFIFLPQNLYTASQINVDCLVALGFTLPPQIGLFFILLKPQLGAPLALFWAIEAWRNGKLKELIRVFAPVTIAFLISFLLFGLWPLSSQASITHEANRAVWPTLIPIGLVLLVTAIKDRTPKLAIAAGPFLTPYIAMYSFPIAMMGFLKSKYQAFTILFGFFIASLSEVWLFPILFKMFH